MAATNGTLSQQDQYRGSTEHYPATSGTTEAPSGNSNGNTDLSKDEIGWYFVEQYYTTLSKSPEKLHLFYGKRSQFVSGPEAETAPVSVGRSAIQERIRDLDFQDCKVRISNVDSQASDDNIVIQVIGETSNKPAELKKFVQTFVLAQQPTGYFVLNDIFRYIKEEVEEEVESSGQEEAAQSTNHEQVPEGVEMPKAQLTAEDQPQVDVDTVDAMDKKPEEGLNIASTITEDSQTNVDQNVGEISDVSEPVVVEEVQATTASTAAAATVTITLDEPLNSETAEKDPEEDVVQEAEKPKDSAPSLSVSRVSPTTAAVPPQPAVPVKPLSWANRAAAAVTPPRPAVPHPKTSSPAPVPTRAPPATQQPSQPAQTTTQTSQPVPAANSTGNKENETVQQPQNAGWQTAGSDHAKRQNRPQSVSNPIEKEGTMGYVRNVTESVKAEELRAALSRYGELAYFDINRQKNCAFVEFATTAGYQAAAAANPHEIAGESIIVEPRRPKSSAYGGPGYNGGRGNVNNRGRGGFDQGRPGNQRGRGDFGANRGRGAPRGRGTGQPTAA